MTERILLGIGLALLLVIGAVFAFRAAPDLASRALGSSQAEASQAPVTAPDKSDKAKAAEVPLPAEAEPVVAKSKVAPEDYPYPEAIPELPEPGRHEDPRFLTEDLTSNRYNRLPRGRLQVVLLYDGDASSGTTLTIDMASELPIVIDDIKPFGQGIETREFDISGDRPLGAFEISGVRPNGILDGLAFGLLWRDDDGGFHLLKSQGPASAGADYVCGWPLGGMNKRLPHLSDGIARETALMTICGAQLLPDGHHEQTFG